MTTYGVYLIYSKSLLGQALAERAAEQIAVYPLAVPLMVSSMGLVTLTAITANTLLTWQEFAILTAALLVVMAINLVALLLVEGVTFNATGEIVGHVLAVAGNGKRK